MKPSEFMAMDRNEKAFVIAAVDMYLERNSK